MNPYPVIVVSADPLTAAAIAEQVARAGFACTQAHSADAYREKAEESTPHAAVWDAESLGQPAPGIPALVLGGDGLQKPLRRAALLARLHRFSAQQDNAGISLTPEWALYPAERVLKHAGNENITLTEKEAELLACILSRPDRSVPREQLLEEVWGYGSDIATHTLETHIYRLRGKLKDIMKNAEWLTATPSGYRIML